MLPAALRTLLAAGLCFLVIMAGCHRKDKLAEKQPEQATASTATANPTPAAGPADDQFAPLVSDLTVGDKVFENRLLRGFYESHGGWRWTARVFAVSLDVPQPVAPTFVEMDFNLPVEVMNQVPKVTLIARVNGQEVARESYSKTGRYYLSSRIPLAALKKTPAVVEFEVDKTVKDQANNGR